LPHPAGFYDIGVGAGLAGAEAAHAAARMGCTTLLVTLSLDAVGRMSCNPAIGGIGKGQIVREIDALGGLMGLAADRAGIQFRMLNRRKGPAVWGPRAQCDRLEYATVIREMLEDTPGLYLRADMVTDLLVDGDRVRGVRTQLGVDIPASAVILTSGTFMNGVIHVGDRQFGGGRMGERASTGLTGALERLGFESGRLKTGTPPRLDGRTIDYAGLEEQPGDADPVPFSFLSGPVGARQVSCWLAYTSPAVHDMLRTGFDRSPMFAGRIRGTGPRYCPSIEDKIDRFADRDRHQLFLEPEGLRTREVYVNGFSTSLPEEVQERAIRLVPGLENVHVLRPGYAIEYDYFPPFQVRFSLETRHVRGLFFAGQINGTTGYEEAAAQGLMAGINAARGIRGEEPLVLRRSDAYIGVLIDDLVTKGTEEPYRMFTSRAEHRILLRQDNADFRLTELGYELGLASGERLRRTRARREAVRLTGDRLRTTTVSPNAVNDYLEAAGTATLAEPERLGRLALRPEVDVSELLRHAGLYESIVAPWDGPEPVIRTVESDLKYAGYLERERSHVAQMSRLEDMRIPDGIGYEGIRALSIEAREKLTRIRPETLGQASRISGVSPADVSVLMVMLRSPGAVSRETSGSP
jgi:tRNA uridine 5-carboxymethylaminomethyl modification enzyme